MELLDVAKKINLKIVDLEGLKKDLPIFAEEKARKSAQYEKQIAITIASLINGKEYELEGRTIKAPPNAMLDKIAKGICWNEHFEMEMAECAYKNCLKIIDMTQSQLMGFQSVNKYLSEL